MTSSIPYVKRQRAHRPHRELAPQSPYGDSRTRDKRGRQAVGPLTFNEARKDETDNVKKARVAHLTQGIIFPFEYCGVIRIDVWLHCSCFVAGP